MEPDPVNFSKSIFPLIQLNVLSMPTSEHEHLVNCTQFNRMLKRWIFLHISKIRLLSLRGAGKRIVLMVPLFCHLSSTVPVSLKSKQTNKKHTKAE